MGLGSVSMPLSLPEDVLAALEEGEPGRLLGTPETAQVCFRGHPYPLETGTSVWELARAVADLANRSGGGIIVGARTAAAADGLPAVRVHRFDCGDTGSHGDHGSWMVRHANRPLR